MNNVELDGGHLTINNVVHVARGYEDEGLRHYPVVRLSASAKDRLKRFREGLQDFAATGQIIYLFNTGCGSKKDIVISPKELGRFQAHYIPAHCVGVGEPFDEEIVRAAMVLRVNSFAKGNSAARLELCEQILKLYEMGVIPCIPKLGSVGSSGDLCPLAHMSATLMGIPEQKAWYQGELLSAPDALKKAGLKPMVLEAKDAVCLTNGATFILATGILAAHDAKELLVYSNIAAALSLEAIRGAKDAFDPRVHQSRNHPGQIQVAEDILRLTEGSMRMTYACQMINLLQETVKFSDPDKKKKNPRIQDAYSFRCYAQVAGSTLETIDRGLEVFEREANAVTDNPLVFEVEGKAGQYEAISCGNFHGEILAHNCDFVKIVVQSLANISDRRFFSLMLPGISYGLPADLAGQTNADLNTGLMILQYTTAALVNRNKGLCFPSSVDSIPTSGNQEDYVSMGANSALDLREVIENTRAVIAAEILAACQGISLTQKDLGNPSLGKITSRVYEMVREVIPPMDDDRFLHTDHHKIINLLKSGKLLEVVQ